MGRPPVILDPGQQFARLTVIGMAEPIFRRPMHKLRCACGGECVQHASSVTSGAVKSCGCYRREAGVPQIRAVNAARGAAKRRDTREALSAIYQDSRLPLDVRIDAAKTAICYEKPALSGPYIETDGRADVAD